MNWDLWLFTPRGRLTALPWALAVELDLIGCQRLTQRQWDAALSLLPAYADF
jgi:hypothetical protein